MAFKKYLKRQAKRAGRALKRRYFKGKGYGNPKIGQMVKDVAVLKRMVNAEKKRFQITALSQPMGQVFGAVGQGMYIQDVTPIPAQGTTSITRTGNSIKLHSTFYKLQFFQMGSAVSPMKGEVLWIKVTGAYTSTPATFVSNMFQLNPFVLNAGSPVIIDYNSDYNPDYFRTFKVIRRKPLYFPADPYSTNQQIKTINVGCKYKNHHVRYTADGSTTPSAGQILMIIRFDNGNMSTTTASTLTNVVQTAANTGVYMNMNCYHYYYDN